MAEARILLAPEARLQCCDAPGTNILDLSAGGTVQLNEHAAAILALCDGTRSPDQIAAEMARRTPPGDSPREDVLEFLDAAIALHWVVASTLG